MNYRMMTIPVIISAMAVVLGACGGGSSSSGGSGGGTKSSANLIVKLNNGSNSAQLQSLEYGSDRLAATVLDFLISRAEAQVGGQTVTVWDTFTNTQIDSGITDANGEVGFVVAPAGPGTYTVCVGLLAGEDSTSPKCAPVDDPITEQDVLTVVVADTEGTLTVSGRSEPRTDNIALFEDTNHPGPNTKINICHKPGKVGRTLSISENAVDAHLNHGDTLGACPVDE